MSLLSPEPLPDTLYHYTDIYGLEGIYRHSELWATNALYLNDTSEMELGLNVVECQLLDQQTALHVEHLELIERGLGAPPGLDELKTLQEIVNEARRLIECYIVSFSENGDQLSQWRAYGKDGYCIGFSTAALQQAFGDAFRLAKVRYHSDDASGQDADEVIELAKALWKDTARWKDDETEQPISDDLRKFAVMNLIAEESAFAKDSNFQEEKEVRAVIVGARANHFTPSPRYGMMPRFKIQIPTEAIESVRVSPGAHAVLRGQSLIRFFRATPFGDDKAPPSPGPSVHKSVIPYRDW